MADLITIHGVRGKIENGTAFLNLEDVARGLGFTEIAASGNETIRWRTVNGYLKELNFIATSCDGSLQAGKDGFIPENIFYRLAMKAKNEVAEAFQAKVADEILPSIRKHGTYMTPETIKRVLTDPDTIIQLATTLKEERLKRQQAEKRIEEQKPMILFAESCIASNDSILVREVAKLASKKDIVIGEKRLWQKLRDWEVVNKNNEPYQHAFDTGWFETKQGTYNTPYGSDTYRTYKVTPKGQIYIIERLKRELKGGENNEGNRSN